MIVAAGFGTRLAPLTDELPKPGVPVANRPLASFALDHLVRHGVRELAVNTHHLADELQRVLRPHCPPHVSMRFVHEPRILGTGGGLRNAWRPQHGEPFLVMNGKLLFAPDLSALLDLHRRSGAIASMVLKPLPADAQFGAVEIDAEGRVRRLLGEPEHAPSGLRRMMFTGVHVLDPRAHGDLPRDGCVIRQAYRRWVDRGEVVMALVAAQPWADLGITPGHYLEGNLALLDGRLNWPGITPDGDANLIHPDARIEAGAQLRRSVVGPGCRVGAEARLDSVVLWEGAQVNAALRETVVTSQGVSLSCSPSSDTIRP